MRLHRMCCASLCGLCCVLAIGQAEQQVLLPTGEWNASILAAQVTTQDVRTELRDGNLRVTTGRQAEWPGVTILRTSRCLEPAVVDVPGSRLEKPG